jgi:inhibitor of cysteine peptidase
MKIAVVLVSLFLGASMMLAADPKPITVTSGEEFKIALESDPSSGNQWLIAKPLDERLLKLLSNEYRRGRPGTAGGGGNDVLRFKALAEGKTQIHLKYGRLWERDAAPARATNFVVVITRSATGPR